VSSRLAVPRNAFPSTSLCGKKSGWVTFTTQAAMIGPALGWRDIRSLNHAC
jgi:hypothetical protein